MERQHTDTPPQMGSLQGAYRSADYQQSSLGSPHRSPPRLEMMEQQILELQSRCDFLHDQLRRVYDYLNVPL